MKLDTSYTSVTWRTNSAGVIFELEVEREMTFLQWLFRKPATQKKWRYEDGSWWAVYAASDNIANKNAVMIKGKTAIGLVYNKNELAEIFDIIESIELHKVMMAKYE